MQMLIKVTWYVYLWTLQLVLFYGDMIMNFDYDLFNGNWIVATNTRHMNVNNTVTTDFAQKSLPERIFMNAGTQRRDCYWKLSMRCNITKNVRSKIVIFSLVQNRSHKTSTYEKTRAFRPLRKIILMWLRMRTFSFHFDWWFGV